ncbi:unnamed protein product [Diamesa serratosioi]
MSDTQQKDNILATPPRLSGSTLMPSPIVTRRTRTVSTTDRALKNPTVAGTVKSFCRSKGHGFITPAEGGTDIFVHISDIEGEYIPQPGDEVSYRICTIPPKYEKIQAIHVHITNLTPAVHTKWQTPCYEEGHHFN